MSNDFILQRESEPEMRKPAKAEISPDQAPSVRKPEKLESAGPPDNFIIRKKQ